MLVSSDVLDSVKAVVPALGDWDRLAVAADLPYCAAAWLMAWWRNAAPDGAQLRVITVREGDRLIGLAPFFAAPWKAGLWRWSLLGSSICAPVEPLAEADARPRVATAIAEALARGRPRPAQIDLNGLPAGSYWPGALQSAWPSRLPPLRLHAAPVPAPSVPLTGADDLDGWLGTRSSNFRQQMRRARRRFEKDGGVFRLSETPEQLTQDLDAFERMHHARWADRGGSAAMTPGVERMLDEAGAELFDDGRLLLASMEIDGRLISSHLFVAAGSEIAYWNGGFDDAADLAPYKPAMTGLVEAVRLAIERGYARLDLGPGAQEYKYRFSDGREELVWQTLVPPGLQAPLAYPLSAPAAARSTASRRLSDDQKLRVKRLLRRA